MVSRLSVDFQMTGETLELHAYSSRVENGTYSWQHDSCSMAARPISLIVALLTATAPQGGPDASSSKVRGVMGVRNELRERVVEQGEIPGKAIAMTMVRVSLLAYCDKLADQRLHIQILRCTPLHRTIRLHAAARNRVPANPPHAGRNRRHRTVKHERLAQRGSARSRHECQLREERVRCCLEHRPSRLPETCRATSSLREVVGSAFSSRP
jgi:hypothetical protein